MHREAYFFLLLDLLISLWIIQTYAFTNIDWQAYVEQVRMVFEDGVLDYAQIRGDSGPIAYPAGFLYLFRLITLLTKGGHAIRTAQYIFMGIQFATNYTLFSIYEEVMPHLKQINGVPTRGWRPTAFRSLVYLSLVISRRIHSIYLLRMFNDAVSMGLFYASTLALVRNRWFLGVILCALATSVKMNILLAIPGVVLLLIAAVGVFQTLFYVVSMVLLHAAIATPFLVTDTRNYLAFSFNLTRKFVHQWTVNFQFIPQNIFEGKAFGLTLLGCTAVSWLVMTYYWVKRNKKGIHWGHPRSKGITLSPYKVLSLVFFYNFVGIVFARTLHYQFYAWFYHQIPFILLTASAHRRLLTRVLIFILIDACFTLYPSTKYSSYLLMSAFTVLYVDILHAFRAKSGLAGGRAKKSVQVKVSSGKAFFHKMKNPFLF